MEAGETVLEGFSSVFKPFIIDKDVCIDGIVANSYTIYALKLPKKQVLWLSEERSCGSAGCHYIYQLLYEEPNKKNIECREWKKEISDELNKSYLSTYTQSSIFCRREGYFSF